MCGIVAYVGNQSAAPVMVEGLKRLEYRGYDSAGLAVNGDHGIEVGRSVGRVSVLESLVDQDPLRFEGTLGVAHTRWATHGEPTQANAHPHVGQTRCGHTVALVHNGIIENYATLRTYLEKKGHTFYSETDTEVLTKLVAEMYQPLAKGGGLEKAVQSALQEVTGAYALAAICDAQPSTLVAARKGSPLLIGIANQAYIVASDPAAVIAHTTQVITLDDYQVARLNVPIQGSRSSISVGGEGSHAPESASSSTGQGPADHSLDQAHQASFRTTTIDDVEINPEVTELEMDLQEIELGGFTHYMLKEIMEQPETIRTCLRGRIDTREGQVVLGGLSRYSRELVRAKRILLTGQGTAYHAGLIGEFLFEDLAKIPARCEYASELRYRNPIIEDGSVVVPISQSGETADTLAALHETQARGALALGCVNVVGSTIARDTDAGVHLRVGPEIGVASTKAFVGQVAVLTLMALYIGRRKFLSSEVVSAYLNDLEQIPSYIARAVGQSDHIRECVEHVVDRDNWLFLGRGYNYPVAMEGALKLKEISYIHAEGMPAAEMKHGPIALIDKGMPVVFIAPRGSQYEKVVSNIEEVRARGGRIIAVADEDDKRIEDYAEFIFRIPSVPEALQPLVSVIPLQLLAYHAAVLRGLDVDKPRNLAKSVTVE